MEGQLAIEMRRYHPWEPIQSGLSACWLTPGWTLWWWAVVGQVGSGETLKTPQPTGVL